MKTGARVRSLQDPSKKMSKSDPNQNAFISMRDDADTIVRKFKRAVTDSGSEVRYSEDKEGVCNLMEIYAAVMGLTLPDVERAFEGKGYGDFKSAVGEAVADTLRPIQARFEEYMGDKGALESLMRQGAERAGRVAGRTLKKLQKKMGFVLL
jgi:tryptophanyl-tRNA synthetase